MQTDSSIPPLHFHFFILPFFFFFYFYFYFCFFFHTDIEQGSQPEDNAIRCIDLFTGVPPPHPPSPIPFSPVQDSAVHLYSLPATKKEKKTKKTNKKQTQKQNICLHLLFLSPHTHLFRSFVFPPFSSRLFSLSRSFVRLSPPFPPHVNICDFISFPPSLPPRQAIPSFGFYASYITIKTHTDEHGKKKVACSTLTFPLPLAPSPPSLSKNLIIFLQQPFTPPLFSPFPFRPPPQTKDEAKEPQQEKKTNPSTPIYAPPPLPVGMR